MSAERRLLNVLISDTGMRLSEALGLVWENVCFDHQYRQMSLGPHPWRPLKTSGSKRLAALVSVQLGAIKSRLQQEISHCFFANPIQRNQVQWQLSLCCFEQVDEGIHREGVNHSFH